MTAKQEIFVQELVKGKSQREAYRIAYNAEKMKPSTIDSKASLLFKKEQIRARYEELMKPEENEAKRMRAFIIEKLQKIASGEICDETTIYDAEDNVIQKKRTVKANDVSNALAKLGTYYGVEEEQKEDIVIVLKGTEGYDV